MDLTKWHKNYLYKECVDESVQPALSCPDGARVDIAGSEYLQAPRIGLSVPGDGVARISKRKQSTNHNALL